MTNRFCPLCSSTTLSDRGDIDGYCRSSSFRILSCGDCSVSFADPLKSDESLYDLIYSQVDKVPGYSRYARLALEIRNSAEPIEFLKYKEDCYFGVIDFLQSALSDASSMIIEIGCGQGYLTYALRKSGFNAVGLDLSEKSIAIAKNNFGDYYHCISLAEYIKSTGANPRYVICTELIEHLEDPVAFVDEMLSACDSNGGLILTTPNKHKLEMSTWNTELPPVHLWWFSEKSLQVIAERVGAKLKIISLRDFYSKNPYKPSTSGDKDDVRSPVFDENRALISPVHEKSKFRVLMRNIEVLIKKILLKVLSKNHSQKLQALPENDEEILSQSLCCFYQKNIR
jgi:2-polyprenyl-3-methyl-5-hydroxy-6-metoxy-1,4-benzoquinol methylase